METKSKIKSKTIQYNSVWLIVASSMLVAFASNQQLLQEYIPGWAYLCVIMFNSGIGVYLRTITDKAVTPFSTNKG